MLPTAQEINGLNVPKGRYSAVLIDRFCWALLYVQDSALTEVLDCFICDLAPPVHAKVLVKDPLDFNRAVFVAERVARAHGKPDRHPAPLGSIPIYFRTMQGPSSHSGTQSGSGGNSGRSNNKYTCHYGK